MITDQTNLFLHKFRSIEANFKARQTTMKSGLLVDPTGFNISAQSALDNNYMNTALSIDTRKAKEQHKNVVKKIAELGVQVRVFSGKEGHEDGIYPNNVFGAAPGRLIIGRMHHPVRKQEADRHDIRNYFTNDLGYKICDLSQSEGVCELTGSLIIDHRRNIGFCGKSNRCDHLGARKMHEAFGLAATYTFDLKPEEYHTNIVLSVLAGKAVVIYPPAFQDPAAAEAIISAYKDRAAIINEQEKFAFVGNCLAITPQDVLFSDTALQTITHGTRSTLEKAGLTLHKVEIDELEKGGGSLRCLIAEVF